MKTATALRNPKYRQAVFHKLDLSFAGRDLPMPSVFDGEYVEKAEAVVGENWELEGA